MKTLNIDTGVEEFSVNGRGVLRFNPGDPNLYHRFFALGRDLAALDGELEQKLAALPGIVVYIAQDGDSLWSIGKKYYVPVARIKEMNDLASEEVKRGDKILVVKG